jgi:uncharacterized protein (TIGR02594 family)
MLRTAVFAACFCALALSCAEARPVARLSVKHLDRHIGDRAIGCSQPDMRPCRQFAKSRDYFSVSLHDAGKRRHRNSLSRNGGSAETHLTAGRRPRAWCGWWLSRHLGMTDRRLWRALEWRHVGRAAHGPAVGAVVVWSRGRGRGHVGIITGKTARGWVVLSGNDGNAVRERVRSVAGAVAFRWP